MKKLTSLAMALALAGSTSSVFAGTSTDNSKAGALHASTTVHFHGTVQAPTCAFRGKSMLVRLPVISTEVLNNTPEGQAAEEGQKTFELNVQCSDNINAETAHFQIHGDHEGNILKNAHGTAKGTGLEIFYKMNHELLPFDKDIEYLNDGLSKFSGPISMPFTVKYAHTKGSVSAGSLATDAVFEIAYR